MKRLPDLLYAHVNLTTLMQIEEVRAKLTALANSPNPFTPLACYVAKRVPQTERPA
jgi:hypothetical protein